MWSFRPARPEEAEEMCAVIRRSIEACRADHGDDPAILAAWLANKTPDRVGRWIAANPAGVIVGVGPGGIAGAGCVLPGGEIALNYVAPWAQGAGLGTGLLRTMEGIAARAGHACCTLTSTVTAHGFYLARFYADDGAPLASFGGKPAYPMRRALACTPVRSGVHHDAPCRRG